MFIGLLVLASVVSLGSTQQSLGKYRVDRTKISVSGISSGAAMATQLHVAYSSVFMGVGLVAGNPYYCAKGSATTATTSCMTGPNNIVVSDLTSQTTYYASTGDIDPTSNLYNSRVFILAGTLDSVVVQGVSEKAASYYSYFVNGANIRTEFNLAAEHTFPHDGYGNACSFKGSPYIGRCDYYGAYELLNHIYPGLTRPSSSTGALPGQFYMFDQSEFFYISPPSVSSMDSVGYVYVPSACVSGTIPCRLHVALHGCSQGRHAIGDVFAMNAGYNQVGEANNIIILYPQAISTAVNLYGCWDWWSYTVTFYAKPVEPNFTVDSSTGWDHRHLHSEQGNLQESNSILRYFRHRMQIGTDASWTA